MVDVYGEWRTGLFIRVVMLCAHYENWVTNRPVLETVGDHYMVKYPTVGEGPLTDT